MEQGAGAQRVSEELILEARLQFLVLGLQALLSALWCAALQAGFTSEPKWIDF